MAVGVDAILEEEEKSASPRKIDRKFLMNPEEVALD